MLVYEIKQYKEITSTNAELKRMAKDGSAHNGTVLIAEKQTAGHGQYERSFESPIGGLYMSVLLEKSLPFNPEGLTVKIGQMVQDVIRESCHLETQIKLPNDILHGGKKLCGILVESFTFRDILYIIVGIGLNLNTNPENFPAELDDIADSISNITGQTYNIEQITNSILHRLKEV